MENATLPRPPSKPPSRLPPNAQIDPQDAEIALSIPPPPTTSAGDDAPVVLVVEDDAAIRAMIVKGLGLSYTVYEAGDGQEALELLEKIPNPAAMVCDVMMPRLDGLSLAKQLKKHHQLRAIPIVFLTAKTGALDVVEGINAGARHYLSKPFKMAELLAKVASVVGGVASGKHEAKHKTR